MKNFKKALMIGGITVGSLLVIGVICLVLIFGNMADAAKDRSSDQKNHAHNFSQTETGTSSCTQDGITVHKCECGAERIELVPASGHSFGEWTVDRAPTCLVAGMETSTCSICNEQQTRPIARTKHNYEVSETQDANQSYDCVYCGDSFTIAADLDADQRTARYIPDCDENYTFRVYCEEDEAYIRKHLTIVDSYFRYTLHETELPYILRQDSNSYWTVSPVNPYGAGNTYVASRSGNVLFEDLLTQDWTFQIHREESKIVELSEDVIFLQTLENQAPGYYPYDITYSEASQTYWVSLKKTDGLKVGDVICVGSAQSLDEVMEAGSGTNFFGKIKQLNKDDVGSYFVELQSPELPELFSKLDVYSSSILSSGEAQMVDPEQMALQATQILYQSEDFAKFLCAAQTTSTTYLSARGYATPLSSLKDFFDGIEINTEKSQFPRVENGVIKGKIVLEGELSIPVHLSDDKDSEQLGEIKLYFEAGISLDSLEIILHLEDQVVEIDGVDRVMKAQIGSQQQITTSFTIGADLNLEWSAEATPYVLNTKTGKYHYKTCKHVTAVKDTSVLSKMTSQELFKKIADESIDVKNECKTCLPISSLLADSLLVNDDTMVVHLPACSHVKGAKAATMRVSGLPLGNLLMANYTECADCKPSARSTNSFSQQVLNTMKTKDLGSSMEEFKALAKEIGDGDDAGELQLVDIPFTITGIDAISLRLGVYFNFTLDANIEYNYEQQINSWFGIYLTDGGFEPYSDSTKKVTRNNLTMTGEARVDLGLKAGINIHLVGLEKFCYADLSAKVGLYAEVHGALQHDFINNKNNYAAAYFEAGLHCDLVGSAKLAFWETGNQSFIPAEYQDLPFLTFGYEKVCYNFDQLPEEITVDSIYYNLEDAGLLNVKYYDLLEMESGTETLNIMGVKDKYSVEFALKNGTNCTVNSGYLLISTPYESFTDELTVTVTGQDDWGKFRRGNVKYTLDSYTVKIRYDAEKVDPTEQPVPPGGIEYNGHYYKIFTKTCTSWEDAKKYCEMKGGYLAVITSKEENDALFAYLKDSGVETAYFGLTDSEQEGQWKWVNGEECTYMNFASGEPNNEGGSENYAEFYYLYPDGAWNDGNFGRGTANDTMNFICEWDTYEFTPETDIQQTLDGQMNAMMGYYQGWYTATQGITGGALGIHRTNALLKDEEALQMYADLATNCSKNKQGEVTQTFTAEDIRKIVEAHTQEYIVIYMFGPLRENPSVQDGLYTMSVEYNETTGEINFKGSQWIQRDTYIFAHMNDVVFVQDALFSSVSSDQGHVGEMSMVRYIPSFEAE